MGRLIGVSLLCVLAVASSGIRAEELSPDEEDKIAAKEDALGDDAMLLKLQNVFTGTVQLNAADKPNERGVIGSFAGADGKNYQLKAASDEVLTQLKKYDQKKATVAGKLRVNGKYLVVLAVVESTPSTTPRDKRKRSGF